VRISVARLDPALQVRKLLAELQIVMLISGTFRKKPPEAINV
jgi:hypothetical protein